MKTIIAGSRGVTSKIEVFKAIVESGFHITEVVSGRARGVDRIGEEFALERRIPLKLFPADWDGLGRAAGHIRNAQMAYYADALIAIWDGASKGTANMIHLASRRGLQVYVHTVKPA